MHVAVIYSKGPNWCEEGPDGEHVSRHIAYQRNNFEAKKLVMGGPFMDEAGGMAIFEVGSRDEAAEIVQNDPAVKEIFYVVTLHPWRIMANRWDKS